MFERMRERLGGGNQEREERRTTVTRTYRDQDADGVDDRYEERRPLRDRDADGVDDRRETEAGGGGGVAAATARDVRARQREEFGGINWGSAFFGWLVTVGMAVILIGLVSAAGAAVGLTEISPQEATDNADTVSIVGGILLLLILVAAYYCGGYVSGRMSRFDGGRQGLAVWFIGLVVAIVLAVAGAIFGAEYNVLEQLNLPRIPVKEGALTTGGVIALAAIVICSLLAAMGGGKAGERFHKKVDRVGYRL
jgi:hypothetical protein